MTQRTPTDYALEFAEYMAKGAEQLIDAVNALATAEQRRDEGCDDELIDLDDLVNQAQDECTEYLAGLRSDIHQFRTRRDRAARLAAEQPAEDAASLKRDLARAHDSANGFVAEIAMLKQQVRELQAFKNMVNRHAPEFPADPDGIRDVWYWQGDGGDHLESMVHQLPIVIRAEQLRELLAAQVPCAA